MTTLNGGIKGVLMAGLIAVSISPILTPSANAGLFDWFRGSGNNSQPANQAQNSAYLGMGTNYAATFSEDSSSVVQGATLINDNFLLANNLPTKESLKKLTQYNSLRVLRELTVSITAYSSTLDQTDNSPFTTALGTNVRDGVVATNFLPFGTKIKIPQLFGNKVFTVEDRMNKRFWQKIDIWFPDRESAIEFGVRNLKIQILES